MATRDTSDQGGPDRKATGPLGRAQDEAANIGQQGMGAAQNRIRAVFEQQSHRAADQLGSVAQALHQAAEQLNNENNGTAARYTVMAADRVEQFADTLRNSTVDDLVGQVEGFARRQPELFVGAAFGLGFLFARFIKSSGERLRVQDLVRQETLTGRYPSGGRGDGGGGPGGRGRGTYDFSNERQNIGGSYPARAAGTGGAPRGRARPSASGAESGVGNTVHTQGSGTRDAAELMAGGSPEPIKQDTARHDTAKHELVKVDTDKQQLVKADAGHADASKADAGKTDAAAKGAAKTDGPKIVGTSGATMGSGSSGASKPQGSPS